MCKEGKGKGRGGESCLSGDQVAMCFLGAKVFYSGGKMGLGIPREVSYPGRGRTPKIGWGIHFFVREGRLLIRFFFLSGGGGGVSDGNV